MAKLIPFPLIHRRSTALLIASSGLIWFVAMADTARAFIPNARWSFSAYGNTGGIGSPATLTWSIVPDGTSIPGEGASDLIAFFDSRFGAGQGGSDLTKRPWFTHIERAMDRWSELGGIAFIYEPFDDGLAHGGFPGQLGVRGDIRFGAVSIDGISNTLGYSHYPNSSDIVLDSDDGPFLANPYNDYIQLRNVLTHEVGHALGFEHVSSSDTALLLEPVINTSFDGPQLDDIRALHHFYGDALDKSHNGLGNDTLASATPLGMLTAGESISVGTDAAPDFIVLSSDSDFVSIANLSDRDYFQFTIAQPANVNMVLTPLGGVFHQGAPGETQSLFDANARNNLTLALYRESEAELLATANSQPAGAVESLTNVALTTPGNYYVRIAGSNQNVQLYQLDISLIATISVLPGDFNSDGTVDAADFTVWRDELGGTGPDLHADGNGDLVVDHLDYSLWKSQFGTTASPATASASTIVPEPSRPLLWIALAIGVCTSQRKAARRRYCFKRSSDR